MNHGVSAGKNLGVIDKSHANCSIDAHDSAPAKQADPSTNND
jgi:hypothetical protein